MSRSIFLITKKAKSLLIILFVGMTNITDYTYAQNTPDYLPTKRLVAWYPFSGSSSDSSGNDNHAYPKGANLTKDRFGNPMSAYKFDGSSYISLDSLQSTSLGPWYTYFGWFQRASSVNEMTILNTMNGQVSLYFPQNNQYYIRAHSAIDRNGFNPAITCESTFSTDTNWHSFAWVSVQHWTNAQWIYIDGEIVCDQTDSLILSDVFLNAEIGSSGRSNNARNKFFNGKIDDVAIWSDILNGCKILQLHHGTRFNASIESFQDSITPGDTIQITCKTDIPNPSYQWFYWGPTDNYIDITGETNDTLNFINTSQLTKFSFGVRISSGSCDTSLFIDFATKNPLGVEERKRNEIHIHPNPSNGQINIESQELIEEIRIHSSIGQLVHLKYLENEYDFQFSFPPNFNNGLYFVTIKTNQRSMTKRLILEKF